MSYLVLARKWRPQTFEDIAGQSHITRTLQNAIRSNRIAHAYLFTGVRGVGKTTAARIVAKALNCENGPTPEPCNRCVHCEEITNGRCIDVLEIDGASNRGIDEVRQIIDNVRYQPARCRFKIYIIDEVHQVTKDAFNALLKTLEEPPPSVKFILATTEPHRLPETILSRCQRFDFRRIPLREIVQRLRAIASREGLTLNDGALVLLAREADGSMRDGQSLLEQVLACAAPGEQESGKSAVVDESLLEEILGLAARRVLYEISAAVLEGDAKRCVELVAEVAAQGRDLGRLSRDLVEQFRNLLVVRLAQEKSAPPGSAAGLSSAAQLVDLPDQEIADLAAQAEGPSVDMLLDYFDFMAAGDEEVNRSANPRFALESALVRLATLPKSLPVAALLERLEKLEKGFVSAPKPDTAPARTVSPLPSTAPARESADRDQLWRNFVSFVGKEKKVLASCLESATAPELSAGQLEIAVAERHHLSYLQDPDNLGTLKDLAKRFFAAEVAVSVTAGNAAPSREANSPVQEREGRNATVNDALRILGGSVRSIKRENG